MARRIKLDVDILHHINDLTFSVFRSTEPDVTEEDLHIMDVIQNHTVKERKMEIGEILTRNSETPYAFDVRRHYEHDVVAPVVKLGSTPIDSEDLMFLAVDKQVEIHSGDIGLFDGRPVYMDYEYKTQPLLDDETSESGKTYFGPVATALRNVSNISVVQDFVLEKFHIKYDYIFEAMTYYYRLFAKDSSGNLSPWSDTKMESLTPTDIFFRIESSSDSETWKEVSYTNMVEWLTEYSSIDDPVNLANAEIRPINSKTTEISFDNPWYHYKDYPRLGEKYRVRAEDDEGYSTEWVEFGPVDVRFEPKEILIRRKINNNSVSSKEGIDAFDVFRLHKYIIDVTQPRIVLTDDQLTDTSIYAYTFFYEDELSKEAVPFFMISDHTAWANIILFAGQEQVDVVEKDFMSTFEWADSIIEIGTEEGQ